MPYSILKFPNFGLATCFNPVLVPLLPQWCGGKRCLQLSSLWYCLCWLKHEESRAIHLILSLRKIFYWKNKHFIFLHLIGAFDLQPYLQVRLHRDRVCVSSRIETYVVRAHSLLSPNLASIIPVILWATLEYLSLPICIT